VLAVIAVCALAVDPDETVTSLDDVSSPKTTFLQTGATATSTMTAQDREEFKVHFFNVAAKLHATKLRSDVLIAERMASKMLDKAGGSGLDLIFRKLEDLEKEIKDEQSAADTQMNQERAASAKAIATENAIIDNAMKQRAQNTADNRAGQTQIQEWRAQWHKSRAMEVSIHKSLVAMQTRRTDESDIVRGEVDERNKAIDVLVKALFLVCERFNRFKNTDLCMQIKSQPDVEEPDRYETKEIEESKPETKATHTGKTGKVFEEAWKKQEEKDQKREDIPCPENPDKCPQANKSDFALQKDVEMVAEEKNKFDSAAFATPGACAERCEKDEQCKMFNYNKKTRLCDLYDVEGKKKDNDQVVSGVRPGDNAAPAPAPAAAAPAPAPAELELLQESDEEERDAMSQLSTLAQVQLPSKYTSPIAELAIAAEAGVGAKKRKNLVQILIAVTEETREEQAVAKATHQEKLDSWYAESWEKKHAINNEMARQKQLWIDWRKERQAIMDRRAQSTSLSKDQALSIESRTQVEDRLKESERVYGVESALRSEDLENLVKLRSLLRALYDSTKPQGCPRTAGVLCTDKVAGWCVFSERVPSKAQRCSCNRGFYGDACQYKMCPGNGDVEYKEADEGVCSNRGAGWSSGRGCDNVTGKCHCDKDYYGRKCEFRHAPPSKYEKDGPKYLSGKGVIDNKCSGRGKLDKIRGICHCEEKFWGPAPNAEQQNGACEERKCPDSNGLLWPSNSANACNGRGACLPESGKCECQKPYFGTTCEKTSCPQDCSGHGACDTNNGVCACKQSPIKYKGPSCMYMECPADCSPPGGECNRNNGKCVCKMGFTGERCERSTRCTARSLNTPETNWYTLWDKPGWIACPKGQLLYGLKRNSCTALSCLDTGSCAAGCEGQSHVYQLRHCYHDLGWYNSFDMAGWSKCLPDYFVAGLYRSCESLYCLQMAKCCSLREARWASCRTALWSSTFGSGGGRGALGDSGKHAFITGFLRGRGHTLKGIEQASYCDFVRGY
jgi:hypothetical protein